MAELVPYPFPKLIERIFQEWDKQKSIFDIKERFFFTNPGQIDFSVSLHDMRASTPFGPASGPHAQMAQNIVMSWLCGARIMELKTVQILDELEIPRPCIDVPNVGYNVEWSQELKVEESLHEYVKGSMLVDLLIHSGILNIRPEDCDTIYDISLGYDLAGIKSEKIQSYVRQMRDASEIVEHYRAQIPEKYAHLRDCSFRTKIANSITLSTFHGCPPDEVEKIASYLLDEVGIHTIVKFNPTLLGKETLREILHDKLGYLDLVVPDSAFDDDMLWEQAVGICERLQKKARQLSLGFGAKCSNTLIVENFRDFVPATEKVMYASGAPLHVLAIHLVKRFREQFGHSLPISFSAGIDAQNFASAVSMGLTPITSCTDLLRKGGYPRAIRYFTNLVKDMKKLGVTDISSYIGAKAQEADPSLSEISGDELLKQAVLKNTASYTEETIVSGSYHQTKHQKIPPKPGTTLEIFDCLTCDICIPVCPNDANFAYPLENNTTEVVFFTYRKGQWEKSLKGEVAVNKKHQIANFADFCNECGNCDTFCPDLGGPYILKPRFFGSLEEWKKYADLDGFYLAIEDNTQKVWGRFEKKEYYLQVDTTQTKEEEDFPVGKYTADGVTVEVSPEGIQGEATEDTTIDGTYIVLMNYLRRGVLHDSGANYALISAMS